MGDVGEIYGMDIGIGDKRQELLNSISLIEGKMGDTAQMDFSDIKSKLFYAKMMLEGGCTEVATEMVGICQEMLEKRLLRYEILVNKIEKAMRYIKKVEELDGDPEEAKKHLDLAEKCFKEGKYKEGVSNAIKSVEASKDEIEKYRSWRTELDSWKE